MKKNILFYLVIFSFFSCKKEIVTIKLLNDNLICEKVPLDSVVKYYKTYKFQNEKNRLKFTNNVKFRITNNTNKKLLFFVNDLKLNDLYTIDIEVFNSENKKIKVSKPILDPGFDNQEDRMKAINFLEYSYFKRKENEQLLKKTGHQINNYFNDYNRQYVIINPNESFIFSSTLSLPFLVEDSVFNLNRPVFFKLDPSKKYKIAIKYELKENFKKIFSKEQLSNLKENNVEIFSSSIESQKIPIVFE